jgi:hypothetical protein
MTREREQTHEPGQFVEEESPDFLRKPHDNLATSIRSLFTDVGGMDLPEIPREPGREPPNFEDDA